MHPPARHIAVPAVPSSGGIPPIPVQDLTIPAAPAGPPLAVITGVIQVGAPDGVFQLRFGLVPLLFRSVD